MNLTPGALVLYKQKPARISGTDGDKLDLDTPGGKVRVRPKDVTLLHPGPVAGLGGLRAPEADARD
ncbi:hypothetical protein, partial [Deinococcus pimensis]|uniref:hypothetical protein n=1 Tax=Deinococcus pimensis TaxID=309888 RepID=UPI0005EBC7C9